ncbi:peptidylprolyl isomerase domain and WD repeat-containing protein 1 isoform X2 [Lucilia cuprina]|uniref:peptidylprolyl isomerase domain and WD repeat-containing protein 1 isoform X2 n=1 Tax=Lucilia cuprina TaxID=7375 RepID=UPI000C71C8AB|nr:peptidylprolyl isomerase domain and WD repeat-containing protein 1 isoform X2 [Lucilia cuprina]KAI8127393.1 Peptidylprolyl isomerase domain and WD repeat-containing protein 1 [Lucilia cuprina]
MSSETEKTLKRVADDTEEEKSKETEQEEEEDGGWIGPLPTEQSAASKPKKKKVLPYEHVFLENLPDAECYEKSYMHRDVITHLVVTKTDFVITASIDGHIKFWKKMEEGIEFVKHFRSHLMPINSLSANAGGTLLCSASADKCAKVFDVINFDMINIIKLGFIPGCSCWIHSPGDAVQSLAISDKESNKIHIYDGQGNGEVLHVLDKLHLAPVIAICYNVPKDTAISVDRNGILEYWQNSKYDYKFPQKHVTFDSKLDTSLFEFAKCKTLVTGLAVSNDGQRFATLSTDRKVRVFKFQTGKLIRVFDEALSTYVQMQQTPHALPNMEFGRRMAAERDLEKSDFNMSNNILFDASDHFLLYPTLIGIKVINIETNRCVNILGKTDNIRPLHIAMFQGKAKRVKAAITLEQEASENPALQNLANDPTLFCTAYKKQRFYMYSRRLPSDLQDVDRDVFNEKPTKEDIIAVPEGQGTQRVYENVVLHTTMGDIHIKLFYKECPKTVENFCVHAKNGYYNNHIFHRVIKGFMIQTGDPTGTGTGGKSIWGHDFKDEFCSSLKHDRPYTVSMANAGPNTNGSQFFITVLPTPWLDNKHTVFGRVFKGMEVCQNICNSKTNPKTDKPYDDIKIISIHLSN